MKKYKITNIIAKMGNMSNDLLFIFEYVTPQDNAPRANTICLQTVEHFPDNNDVIFSLFILFFNSFSYSSNNIISCFYSSSTKPNYCFRCCLKTSIIYHCWYRRVKPHYLRSFLGYPLNPTFRIITFIFFQYCIISHCFITVFTFRFITHSMCNFL